jgi:hypothetical protein
LEPSPPFRRNSYTLEETAVQLKTTKKIPAGPVPQRGDSLEKKRISAIACEVFGIIRFFHSTERVAHLMVHLLRRIIYIYAHTAVHFTTKISLVYQGIFSLFHERAFQRSEKMRGTVAKRRQEH